MQEKYVGTKEVAEALGCTKSHVALLCRQGKIKATQPFGRWRISQKTFDEIMGQEYGVTKGEENGEDGRIDI